MQESTLHIFCTPLNQSLAHVSAPNKKICLRVIYQELEGISPQGILAASVYGQQTHQSQPEWIDSVSLPAQEQSAFQTSALELAANGDEEAIIFLLERLLNPDLHTRLQTGNLRIILRHKCNLIHLVCDAPICPGRKQVSKPIIKFLQQLGIAGIGGVRIYGRRAGNKEPFWHYGVDFHCRQRLVPEATPEFAATAAYVGDLIPNVTTEPIIGPALTKQEVNNLVGIWVKNWGESTRNLLLRTQLLIETEQPPHRVSVDKGHWVGLIWGSLGLLLTFQADWLLGKFLIESQSKNPVIARVSASYPVKVTESSDFLNPSSRFPASRRRTTEFNASVFTNSTAAESNSFITKASREQTQGNTVSLSLSQLKRMPSFNSQQLDNQLALYRQRLAKNGQPPQVLIIGSSRALRGIDPVALCRSLSTQGYTNIDAFHFGINGATAQVVDFMLRHVLKPSELPKLILWADGSRGFNSGRDDATFGVIADSPGYQYALQHSTSMMDAKNVVTNSNLTTGNNTDINQSLNEIIADISPTYQNRDSLKGLLNKNFHALPLVKGLSANYKSNIFEKPIE